MTRTRTIDTSSRRRVAESLLGEIRWTDEDVGYCQCPGADQHTHKSNRRECRITLDGVPTVFCSHQSCAGAVAETNAKLRSEIGKAETGGKVPPPTVGELVTRKRRDDAAAALREKETRIAREARETLPVILRDYAWSECDVWEASRLRIDCQPADDAALFLRSMYAPDDVVWIGETWDSGKPEHAKHFKSCTEWLAGDPPLGPLICPALFRAGVHGRTQDNIAARPYVVLEGDAADPVCAEKQARGVPLTDHDKACNRAACLAVLNWCRLMTELRLRAIVDSGSKSMHGWFDLPDESTLEEMKLILPALGFDAATLRPAQPVRLPGVRRAESGRWQRLLYLNPRQIEDLYANAH